MLRSLMFLVLVILSSYCLYLIAVASFTLPVLSIQSHGTGATTPIIDVPASVVHNWAMYAPFFLAGVPPPLPTNCEVDQVNILQRHGARFPTASSGAQIQAAVAKLRAALSPASDPRLAFIANYTYTLGHDDLIPFGAAQSFDAGQSHFARYAHLVAPTRLPFVRASSSQRVVDSATNWTAGFAAAADNKVRPILNLILDESGNDTLHNACPAAPSSDPQTNTWLALFAPSLAARLNMLLAGTSGAQNTSSHSVNDVVVPEDIPSLMSLCAFDTLAHPPEASAWCAATLWNTSSWDAYEYFGDLGKYYGTGYGNPLGRVQGAGYVNELLARLTGQPVHDSTQTNRTLDCSSPLPSPSPPHPQSPHTALCPTFPLSPALFADFSHDNQLAAIFSALGLFPATPAAMNPSAPIPARERAWDVARMVPFAGRAVVERVVCGAAPGKGDGEGAEGTYVRVLVNDAVQPLAFCGGATLCALGKFVEGQGYARGSGGEVMADFTQCFVEKG